MKGPSRGEIFDELSNWNVGAGMLTMALLPFALPGIALALVLALPLVAFALPLLLIGGIITGAFRLVRGFLGLVGPFRVRRRRRTGGEAVSVRTAARHT
ncbi:MAG: hypothetical protein E6G49_01715 [Actinobacteria bacterium]|nr:MAG: hypothetical protein E6G49_01715 [Actinomycetota bacterium]